MENLELKYINIEEFEKDLYSYYLNIFPTDERKTLESISLSYKKNYTKIIEILYKEEIIGFMILNKIKDNDVWFPNDIHFAEDLVFTLRYLQYVEKAVICDRDFYYYRCNPNSIMNSFFAYKEGMFQARKRLIQYLDEIIEEFTGKDNLQRRLVVTSRCYFRECIGNACRTAEGRTKKDIRQELKEILNDDNVIAAFANFDAVNRKTKMLSLLIKYRWAFIIQAYYSYRFYKR